MDRSTDPMNSARGIIIALLVSLPLCVIVGAAGYSGYQKLKVIHLPSQEAFSSYRTANGGQP